MTDTRGRRGVWVLEGVGTIEWITTAGIHVPAARFALPWRDTWLSP